VSAPNCICRKTNTYSGLDVFQAAISSLRCSSLDPLTSPRWNADSKNCREAIDETKGAKSDYQGLMKELYSLERVLVAIKSLETDHLSSDEVSTLRQAMTDCQTCIDNFLKTIKSYQSLTAGKSTPRDQILKIKWALGHKDDVQKFRETLDKRTTSLSLLLSTIQLGHSLTLEESTGDRLQHQSSLLGEIQASILVKDAEHLQLLRRIEGLLIAQSQAKPDDQSSTSKFTLPFKLNGAPLAPAFVQRPEVMQAVEDQLLPISETQQTVLVLRGMGGMGKSQIAREYACKHKTEYTAIFWVNARSKNTLKDGVAGIARRLGLTDILNKDGSTNEDDENMDRAVSAALKWFNGDGNTRWLLILDNVDSQVQFDSDNDGEERSTNAESFDALPFVPSSSQGTLLVTSRLSYLARTFGGTAVSVDQMTLHEGLEVLCRLSSRKSHEPGAEELVKRLGYHPLSLSQCGRYVLETQDSFMKYLARYETKLKSLLNQNPSKREYQNGSIVATLGLSYEALKAQNPTAAALLAFCGCLDNTDIFWKLLEFAYRIPDTSNFPQVMVPALSWIPGLDPDWFPKIQSDEAQYDGVVRSLLMFSFARQNLETSSISIHPIVHQWSLSLYGRDLRNAFLERIADLIGRYFLRLDHLDPTSSIKALFHRLQPHADRCFALIRSEGTNLGWAAATVISFGSYFSHQYQRECAEFLVNIGLPLLEREEKCDISLNCVLLRVMVSKINIYWDQDHGKSIANLCAGQKVARAVRSHIKADSISFFEIYFAKNLSNLYITQERYSEACEMWDHAVEHFAKEGENRTAYWMAMTAKAEVIFYVGDTAEAVRLCEDIELNVRRLLEAETAAHPLASSESHVPLECILGTIHSLLGSAYAKLRQWGTSQEYRLSALIVSETIYGPTDSVTLSRAADYMGVVEKWVTKGSLMQKQKWHNTVHDLLIAANLTNRVVQSVKRRTSGSCDYDRWSLIFSAVRTSIRHRPGTELYSRLSKKQPLHSLSG